MAGRRGFLGLFCSLAVALSALLLFAGCEKKIERIYVPVSPTVHPWVLQHPNPLGIVDYWNVYGVSANSIYAVGDDGTIAHFDGTDWKSMDAGGYTERITHIWGATDNDMFAVGYDGVVLRYDGTKWRMTGNLPSRITALWGFSDTDVWAVGRYDGKFYDSAHHYDGAGWSDRELGGFYNLNDVWGSAANDVYAVGDTGIVVHFDGTRWARIDHGLTRADLRAVWGSGAGDVWAVGPRAILHYDGTRWTLVDLPGMRNPDPIGVYGTSSSDVYVAITSGVWHYDGATFTRLPNSAFPFPVRSIWAASGELVGVGYYGNICTYEGSGWVNVLGGPFASLYDVWTDAPDNAWAVGEAGTILHYNGSLWSDQSDPLLKQNTLLAISGTRNSLYAVGYSATVLHYDGTAWESIWTDTLTSAPLYDVWAQGNEAFAVGYGGRIIHVQGNHPESMDSHTKDGLVGVWGSAPNDVFAVGVNSGILHYDGKEWSRMANVDSSYSLECIWGTGPDNVYAGGWGDFIILYDGKTWNVLWNGWQSALRKIWGTSPTNIYALASFGAYIGHYDGTRWITGSSAPGGVQLGGISGSAPDNIFAVGDRGVILHYGP